MYDLKLLLVGAGQVPIDKQSVGVRTPIVRLCLHSNQRRAEFDATFLVVLSQSMPLSRGHLASNG